MHSGTFWKRVLLGLALAVLGASKAIVALAAETDQEPNNSCSAAQNLGAVPLPALVNGSLGTSEVNRDIDFFRVVATPESVVQIKLQGSSGSTAPLTDPLLGVFTQGCGFLGSDFQFSQPATVLVRVPSDGVLIIAATQYPDFNFIDGGVGSYRLDIAPFDTAKSIRGRLIDAVTRFPVGSGSTTFASVGLLRCDDQGCFFIAFQNADADGRFLFTDGVIGGFLIPGQYKIVANAAEYDQLETDVFEVGANEDKDVGDLALTPFPIRITLLRPCAVIPVAGGRCDFSVQFTNRLAEGTVGRAWSIVTGFNMGSRVFSTEFQADGERAVRLPGLSSKALQFTFDVPGNVSQNASFCVHTWFGEDRRDAYFNPLAMSDLFCVAKLPSGTFQALSKKESLKLFEQLNDRKPKRLRSK
jgi:hypothetical protein